ncbi:MULTISPECIES: NHLP-related RiPP peptide [unclassified Duganella]|jgi:putative modified peptide|uniref:NHLP-related RiPP peptide n=1 Tax=unclassified Duganella TaxID=2636909 RepID=UPI00088E42FB|nr:MULTISPECIES: NHLP-related RiPP peptide [unclassified Duganella]SDG83817.1 putative modified peptide [Duganella sp. OV458]SDK11245.1 putative modified peptide [Duganella sp. OV510]
MNLPSHSSDAVNVLLDKLANDDDFRAKLLAQPAETLAGIGINAGAGDIPDLRTLPSKEVVQANRVAMQEKLGSPVAMALFLLAGTV